MPSARSEWTIRQERGKQSFDYSTRPATRPAQFPDNFFDGEQMQQHGAGSDRFLKDHHYKPTVVMAVRVSASTALETRRVAGRRGTSNFLRLAVERALARENDARDVK